MFQWHFSSVSQELWH